METSSSPDAEVRGDRDLGDTFRRYFELVPALDDDLREQVFRVRHSVYCEDLGWEPVRANGLETDAFDPQSIHCLLRHVPTGAMVGTTRLILADDDPSHELPVESSCRDTINRQLLDPRVLPRLQVGEVSRLAVARQFRQRKGEAETAGGVSEDDFMPRGAMSRFPFIPVALYMGAAAVAQRLGREYVLVLTEPRLALHFSRIGFDIQKIGEGIEHRGLREPSLLRTSKVIAGLRPLIQPIWSIVEASVNDAYAKAAS